MISMLHVEGIYISVNFFPVGYTIDTAVNRYAEYTIAGRVHI